MTIFKKIAIEPASLTSWEKFRYVMEKLHFSNGLVLSKFPKRWERELLDNLDVGDIERQRIITKLQSYKSDRMVPSGTAYEPKLSWVENIQGKFSELSVDKVLASTIDKLNVKDCLVSTPDEADDGYFNDSRELIVDNTSSGLCDPAEMLLSCSEGAIFVDPYLQLYKGSAYLKTIIKFSEMAASFGKCKEFTLVTRECNAPKNGAKDLDKLFTEAISPVVKSNFKIVVKFIDDATNTHPLHARYFLTEKGGLRYDKGFQSASPPVKVDVSLIDKGMHNELYERFTSPEFYRIEQTCIWIA